MKLLPYLTALLLVTTSLSAQSIDEMLRFINTELTDHNAYNSNLSLNQSAKQFILSDKFGTFVVPMEISAFRATDGKADMLELYCLDGSKCLSLKDVEYRTYSMKVTGADRDKMLRYLARIRSQVYGGEVPNTTTTSTTTGPRYKTTTAAKAAANVLLDRYNAYDSRIDLDSRRLTIKFKDKFNALQLHADQVAITYIADKKLIQFKCRDGSTCLNDDNSVYTISLKDNNVHQVDKMQELTATLNEIHDKMRARWGDSVASTATTTTTDRYNVRPTDSPKAINRINELYRQYNSYNTKWSLNGTRLFWTNDFDTYTIDLDEARVITRPDKQWVVVECDGGAKCIDQKSTGKKYYTNEYSMTVKDDAALREVGQLFSSLKSSDSDGGSTITPTNVDKSDALARINELYRKYNGYDTRWSLSGTRLSWTNRFDTYTVDLNEARIAARPDKQWIVVECDGDANCIDQKSTGRKYTSKEYSMTVKDDAAVRELEMLFESLETAVGTNIVSKVMGAAMVEEKSAVIRQATLIIELVGTNAQYQSTAIEAMTNGDLTAIADNMAKYQQASYDIEAQLQDLKRDLRKAKLQANSDDMSGEARKFQAYLDLVDKATKAAERTTALEQTRDFWMSSDIDRLTPILRSMNDESKIIVVSLKQSSVLL